MYLAEHLKWYRCIVLIMFVGTAALAEAKCRGNIYVLGVCLHLSSAVQLVFFHRILQPLSRQMCSWKDLLQLGKKIFFFTVGHVV